MNCQGHEEDDDSERGEGVSNLNVEGCEGVMHLEVEGSEGVMHLEVDGSERNLTLDVVAEYPDQNYITTEQVRNNAVFVVVEFCINFFFFFLFLKLTLENKIIKIKLTEVFFLYILLLNAREAINKDKN